METFKTETRNKRIRIVKVLKNRITVPVTIWFTFDEYDKIKELVRFGTIKTK